MTKDINKHKFSEETLLKLDIFRKCFREWLPVFLHNPLVQKIYVYDLFAGSGKDSVGNCGSPLILLKEASRIYCKTLNDDSSRKYIVFGFNEFSKRKALSLENNIKSYLDECKKNCQIEHCLFDGHYYIGDHDTKKLLKKNIIGEILGNEKYAKFVLLDQYGFSQIDDDIFIKLVNSPKTDFIFFIASSFIRRFKTQPAVTAYFRKNDINFDESKPKECHKVITEYFRKLVPTDKEYYLHSFTIQKGSNYYGLIFGSNHTLGMEKFVKVCWNEDKLAGESNCNINNDYDEDSLFFNPDESNKKREVSEIIRQNILNENVKENTDGLKLALKYGVEPKLYVNVIEDLIKRKQVQIVGPYNKQATNIHKVKRYQITVL
jgi:three-Cys-motif partner protein